jgi:membrane-bound lytic murein transglycosylase F
MLIPFRFFVWLYTYTLLGLLASTASATPDKTTQSTNTRKEICSTQLEAIKKRGYLRIIVPANLDGGQFLPRFASPVEQQQKIAQDFAKSLGLSAEIVPVFAFKDMFPALLTGKGDLIAANLTITEQRKTQVAFSVPIDHVKEVVLSNNNQTISSAKALAGKSILVHPATAFWNTAQKLQQRYPTIKVIPQGKYLHDEEGLDLIADEEYDATIRDSNVAAMYLSYRDDIKIAFSLTDDKAIVWAIHPDAKDLKAALDQYLTQIKLSDTHNQTQFGDLAKIKKRGVLRILLKNNASSYFFWKGQLMGFEYEMAQAYAKHLGVKLAVIVPPENTLMLDWLKAGKADLAAGFLSPTPQWQEQFISASKPYHRAAHHLVTQKNNQQINRIQDLAGKTVVVHKSSPYWQELAALQQYGIAVNLQAAPETMEIEEILEKVALGKYPATLVDKHLLDIETAAGVDVKSAFAFEKIYNHALAVREENTELLKDLNQYISKQRDGTLYERLYRKYFANSDSISRLHRARLKEVKGQKVLSAYDKTVKKYAKKYNFDWRLITAQMFHESRFRPHIRSSAGAIGLMQVMSNTGKQLKLRKLSNPTINIHAGIKYMAWLAQRFEHELPVSDRMWFTLASYNAGLGHVLDARRLAARIGLNKNRWFGHVEKAMLLLSKKNYYAKARYGYVRGREPVNYVKRIKALYENYLNIVE